jgi:hypothetical protein
MSMSLQNLVGISLGTITPARETVQRLLEFAVGHGVFGPDAARCTKR